MHCLDWYLEVMSHYPELLDHQIHARALYTEYAKRLDYDEEKISTFEEIYDSVKAVLEKHDVYKQSINWDRRGVKLIDHKVVLPDGMDDVLVELMKDNQLANLFLPEEFGGFGYTHILGSTLKQLVSEYDFSLSMLALSGVGVMNLLVRYYNEHFDPYLKKLADGEIGYVSFTEPQAGSNLRAIKSTSELVGDEYVLNGTKIYISNGGIGTIGLFLANNIVDGQTKGTNVFVVEGNDGITPLRLEEKSGLKASPTAQLLYENVTVPKENLIGEIGMGYDKVLERLMGMRLAVAFQSLAACTRAYKLSYDYAMTREQFNKPIISFADIQRKLSFMTEQIPKLQEIAYSTAFALDLNNKIVDQNYQVSENNTPHISAGKDIPVWIQNNLIHYYVSSSKVYSAEITNYMLYDAQQVFGGLGFISETEVNKIARDVRVLPIFDGTSEIHKWIIHRAEKTISELDDFTTPMSTFNGLTIYETILYTKFPDLEGKL